MIDPIQVDIVLLTVNAHEREQLHSALKSKGLRGSSHVQGHSNEIYCDFGELNGQRIFAASSLIGSTGEGASFDTISNVVADLKPKVIIAVGIAWGGKEDSGQKIGDVLLSTRMRDAQHHKAKPGEVIPRGIIVSSRGTLVKTFLARAQATNRRAHEGMLLSIETLFDDKEHRDKFLNAEEGQAIGGEMEGSGLLMALRRVDHSVDWLIVKGICDWGFKKNFDAAQKERDQKTAAKEAAELCVETIAEFRLTREPVSSRQVRSATRSVNSIEDDLTHG